MSWFTENPWPVIVILGLVGGACVASWTSNRRASWLAGGIAALLVAIGLYFYADSVVTEGERIEQDIRALTKAFTNKERERTLGFFSAGAGELKSRCETAMAWVEFPNGLDVKDVSVTVTNDNSRAVSRFRANGRVSVKGAGETHAASRWEFTWQKEAGQWKIIDVIRLNPYKDEKMDYFDPRQN
ncbi:MAG: nuclear transport factor 2 family protein [Planctomycetes bacterium]|nr:nuclear transport factor 2 family protein [Planctomycetota bacterium]